MIEHEKGQGFMDKIKNGLSHVSYAIVESIAPHIAKGAENIMKNVDDRIIRIENRIFRKISSLLIIWFGGVFLIFALFFFLIDFLRWSNSVAFFSIGIIIFVIGLLLKVAEPDR